MSTPLNKIENFRCLLKDFLFFVAQFVLLNKFKLKTVIKIRNVIREGSRMFTRDTVMVFFTHSNDGISISLHISEIIWIVHDFLRGCIDDLVITFCQSSNADLSDICISDFIALIPFLGREFVLLGPRELHLKNMI